MRLPTLARDRSKRPVRGAPIGDMVTGICEAVACGIILHRGDEFVVYLGDRPMCRPCHVAGAALIPLAAPSARGAAATRAPAQPRAAARKLTRKKDLLLALRRARTRQLKGELQ